MTTLTTAAHSTAPRSRLGAARELLDRAYARGDLTVVEEHTSATTYVLERAPLAFDPDIPLAYRETHLRQFAASTSTYADNELPPLGSYVPATLRGLITTRYAILLALAELMAAAADGRRIQVARYLGRRGIRAICGNVNRCALAEHLLVELNMLVGVDGVDISVAHVTGDVVGEAAERGTGRAVARMGAVATPDVVVDFIERFDNGVYKRLHSAACDADCDAR